MKTTVRLAVLTIAAASTLVATTAPASSAVSATSMYFEGDAWIGCFGCGEYGPEGNGATIWAAGVFNNQPVAAVYGETPGNGGAAFIVYQSSVDPECLISGAATGTVQFGATTAGFTWSRIGAFAVIGVSSLGAIGHAGFVVTDPIGDPCGGPIIAHFAGVLYGATI